MKNHSVSRFKKSFPRFVRKEKTSSIQTLLERVAKLLLVFLMATIPSIVNGNERPNVILVMADDLGLGDISPTNPAGKIKTPNLQEMANQGLTFLDAHTPSSVCTPTRYGLLTGRYNWRSRLARGVLNGRSQHLIPATRPTLGHLMQQAGYHTAMIGKWHLGWDWAKKGNKIDFTQPVKNGPDINGFDQYYGHSGSLDMPPYVWVNTGHVTVQPEREEGVSRRENPYGWYRKGPISADFKIAEVLPHLFNKSIAHIKERQKNAKTGKPFFLYLALPAPHTPIVPIAPFKGASKLNPYADFVMQIDHHMGQLFAALKEAGLEENTLVIFTSDNGCSPEANFSLLKAKGHDPSAGFRGYKADIYEGGHRVPLIFRWPGHIQQGQKTNALACLTDIYSTLEEITAQPRQPLGGEDGYSLVSVFNGAQASARTTLVSHSIQGKFAIRQGSWKLCLSPGSGGWSKPHDAEALKKGLPPMQLFDLSTDPAEQKNLVKEHPEKVTALLKILNTEVKNGRCTPGKNVSNDRKIKFLPAVIQLPIGKKTAIQKKKLLKKNASKISAKKKPTPDRKIVYKKTPQGELKLHLFQPKDWKATDRRGAIVFFFGGGWSSGSPRQFYPHARQLADRGMLAISAEYRVKTKHKTTPFESVADAQTAIQYLREHASELGIDTNRIAASGGSAGGHLAVCTALLKPSQEKNLSDQSSNLTIPNVVIAFNPVIDTSPKGYGNKVLGKRYRELSPVEHVRPKLPPMLIFHGTADTTVPFENIQRFDALMKQANNDCKVVPFQAMQHGFFNFGRNGNKPYLKSMQQTEAFLKKHGFLK